MPVSYLILTFIYLSFFPFSCVGGVDSIKYHNEVELFEAIDPNVSILAVFGFFWAEGWSW